MKDIVRMARHGLLVLTTLGAAGCSVVGSIYPVISDTNAQYDSLLVGAWQDSTGEVVVIKPEELEKPYSYSIVLIEQEGAVGHFRAVVGRVAGYRVLDLGPDPSKLSGVEDGAYTSLLLPLHAPLFIDSIGTELRLRVVNYDSLSQYLQRDPDAVAHVSFEAARDENYLVLTAPTVDVQGVLARYLSHKGLLDKLAVWRRIRAEENSDRPRLRGRVPRSPRSRSGDGRH